MPELEIPFPLKGLPLKPEIRGRQKIDEVLIQTLSALLGYDGEGRRLIKCSLGGSLHVTTPQVSSIVNKVSTGAAEDVTFSSLPTTEVMVKALATNSGLLWVNIGAAGAANVGWPLSAGEFVNVSINNMADLQIHIVTSGDRLSIIKTV